MHVLILALLLSQSTPQSRKTIVMPTARIVCDAACKDRVQRERNLDKLLEDLVFDKVAICPLMGDEKNDGEIWVRYRDASFPGGQCFLVKVPRTKRTGWR